jgi:hypothetical protein
MSDDRDNKDQSSDVDESEVTDDESTDQKTTQKDNGNDLDTARIVITLGGIGILLFILFLGVQTGGLTGQTADVNVSEFDYVDGMNESGVTDAQLAIESHNEYVRNDSYTISINAEGPNGTSVSLSYEYDDETSLVKVSESNVNRTTLIDYEDSQGYEALDLNTDNETFERFYVAQSENRSETSQLEFSEFLRATNITATEVLINDNGEREVVYDITEPSQNVPSRIDINGELRLNEEGYFSLADVTITQTRNNTTTSNTQNIRIDNIGTTTVEEPSWFDRAVEQTDEAEPPELNQSQIQPPTNNSSDG